MAWNSALTWEKVRDGAEATPKLYWPLISVAGNIGQKYRKPESTLTNSKPFHEPLEALSQAVIAVEREPEALSHALTSLRPLPNDRVHGPEAERSRERGSTAAIGLGPRRLPSESGTLWVRPWGGK